ncbi:AfsR/SARP family transcriptional regulator, partial [Streptomyces boncukensis]
MRVEILGPPQVRDAQGRVTRIGGSRLRAVLVRLARDAGQPVSAEALYEAVWPEGDGPADPGHALHALASRLRRLLPEGAELSAAPGGYRLQLPDGAVDAHQFERLVREGQRALADGRHGAAAETLREALALWRGEPFGGMPGMTAAAARLEELRLSAVEDRIAAELPERGGELVAELRELTAAHPLRERAHALLMRALCADGRTAQALGVHEEIRRRLADELGTDPGADLHRAHQTALHTAGPPEPP